MDTTADAPPTPQPPPSSPLPRSRARWWIHLAILGLYPPVLGLIGWLTRGGESGPLLASAASGLAVGCLWELSIFGVVFGVALLASHATASELYVAKRVRWSSLPLGFGYSIGIRLLLAGVVLFGVGIAVVAGGLSVDRIGELFQEHRPKVEALVSVSALRDDPMYRFLAITVVSFGLGGLREELWRGGMLAAFRALWPERFGSTRGQMAAVVLAAIVFGLGHAPQGPLASAFAGVLGVALGGILVFHRSIWPAVFAHGFFDATSLVLIPWAMSQLHTLEKMIKP